MQLVGFKRGRLTHVPLTTILETDYVTSCVAVEDEIRKLVTHGTYKIDNLSLDFAGRYIALVSDADIRLCAALLAAYNCDNFAPNHEQERLEEDAHKTKLNTYSPKQLKMSDALHTALGQWLDTPRTLGELNTLLFVFNEGLLFCVEDGNDCEAEHFCMEEADVQALELAMQPHESNEALSLKSFEEELMRLGEDDA